MRGLVAAMHPAAPGTGKTSLVGGDERRHFESIAGFCQESSTLLVFDSSKVRRRAA